MSDPRVESCSHRIETQSGKTRCIFPGRSYYFCETNRMENVCPIGLTTTYDDPVPQKERPLRLNIENSIEYFHEHHDTTRWDLKDCTDSYLLYYQLDILQFRYFELAIALSRSGQHKKSHYAWAKSEAYDAIIQEIFPYYDGGGKRLYEEYQQVQKSIAALEEP
jgi:hypothetical protein